MPGRPSASLTDAPGTEGADDPQAWDDEMTVHLLDHGGRFGHEHAEAGLLLWDRGGAQIGDGDALGAQLGNGRARIGRQLGEPVRRDATEVALDEQYPLDPITGWDVIHAAHATPARRSRKLGSSLELARARIMGVIDADGTVVGREHELDIVRSFCASRTHPGALLLEGDAGIGKTVLWEAGLAIASAAGHTVLRCRPAAAEAQLSFAALADLLVDVLDEALPALAAPQRRALEVALLLDEAEGPPPDVRALAAAFLGVLRHASSSSPVLVAIDDAQWLDEPSRTVLEFAVRRLSVEPVGVLASRRGTGAELPLGLGQALAPDRLQQLSLSPLSMGALHRLVQSRLGTALSRPVLRRLHAESGGNPFYALEIGRALQRRGSAPRSDEPLPVPPTLRQLVQERVTTLPDRVRRLLELVAACCTTVGSTECMNSRTRKGSTAQSIRPSRPEC